MRMRRVLLLTAMAAGVMSAQTPAAEIAPADSLNALVSMIENRTMTLMRAMPAEKYSFTPGPAIFNPAQKTDYTGVRSFGGLAVHLAQANYGLGSTVSGMKPEIDVKALEGLTGKEQIVSALEESFAFVHKAIATITPQNAFQSVSGPMTRATQAAFVAMHAGDEYGQMVEYLRMNGITPPASVKK